MTSDETATQVVDAVLSDLIGRKGFDWAWDDIDAGIQAEIRETLTGKVRALLDT